MKKYLKNFKLFRLKLAEFKKKTFLKKLTFLHPLRNFKKLTKDQNFTTIISSCSSTCKSFNEFNFLSRNFLNSFHIPYYHLPLYHELEEDKKIMKNILVRFHSKKKPVISCFFFHAPSLSKFVGIRLYKS